MASKSLVNIDGDIDKIIEAGKEFAKGRTAKAVAAQLGVSTKEAKRLYEQYKQMAIEAARKGDLGDRLALAVEETLLNYETMLTEAWRNKEDAEANMEFSTVNTSLRLIKDMNESRFKMLHQMVDGQDTELLEELDYMERRQEEILDILKDLKEKYPDAARYIAKRLQELEGGVQVVSE